MQHGATTSATRIDYGRRVARVAAHIAAHLDAALDIETLASVAHFSPWHFHRIYRGLTGETVADTVRRLRLHRAAVALIRSEAPLRTIAHRAGYGTPAAFSRAFSSQYGLPPGAYRRRRRLSRLEVQRRQEAAPRHDVTIAPFAGVRLAVIAHRGDYQDIGGTFEAILAWVTARGVLRPDSRSIAIYYDDPVSVPLTALRAEAGMTIDRGVVAGAEVRVHEIPPLICASVTHRGPYAELERAYEFLYREWLPASGRQPADHPCFEEYLNNPREHPASEWLTRIHLPVTP